MVYEPGMINERMRGVEDWVIDKIMCELYDRKSNNFYNKATVSSFICLYRFVSVQSIFLMIS